MLLVSGLPNRFTARSTPTVSSRNGFCPTIAPQRGRQDTDSSWNCIRFAIPTISPTCTLLFDLEARQLSIYTDNPVRAPTDFVALAM